MVMSPEVFGPENDCVGEGQKQFKTTDPSSHQSECYIRIITASVHLKNTCRGSQGLVAKTSCQSVSCLLEVSL
jgi:hypothetical protein